MRALLTTLNAKYIHTNLAIRILYEQNQQVPGLEWKEFTIKENRDEIAAHCAQFNLVAFSCYIWNITQTLEVARLIKILNPATMILLGGPEVSYDNDALISKPEVDYIIEGEGEIPFSYFLEHFPEVTQTPALVYKVDEKILRNKPADAFDVKEFAGSMPYRFDDPGTLAQKVLYIETSRGCPYKCEFCLASLDNKVRYLPDSCIKSTLLYLMQHGRVIKFLDRTFNIKRDFTLDIFRFILEHRRPGNVFQFEITADILHPDIIKFIHEEVPPGLFRFEIGIQTVNQKANLEVKRKQNFDKTRRIVEELAYKVEMHLDLIVGLPLDYWEDIKYSFESVFSLHAPELQLGFLKFLKGTPMRDKEVHGYVYDPEPPYQIISSKYLSAEELHQITILENALEIYWNSGKAVNTLKYVSRHYSIFDFLLGLGKHFGSLREFHRFSLNDVFSIADQFVKNSFPADKVLSQLVAVDYYLHHKVRPQPLFDVELTKEEKNSALLAAGYHPGRQRIIGLTIDFDFQAFLKKAEIVNRKDFLFLLYDGQNTAQVLDLRVPEAESLADRPA